MRDMLESGIMQLKCGHTPQTRVGLRGLLILGFLVSRLLGHLCFCPLFTLFIRLSLCLLLLLSHHLFRIFFIQ